MNLIEGRLERTEAGLVCAIGDQTLTVPEEVIRARPALQGYAGRVVGVGIRPEHIDDAVLAADGAGRPAPRADRRRQSCSASSYSRTSRSRRSQF